MRRRSFIAGAAALTATPTFAATPLFILSLDGGASNLNITRSDLEALPQESFATSTPWTGNVNTYTGPSVRRVLEAVGFAGDAVEIEALDTYKVQIPLVDLGDRFPIFAHLQDGAPMSIRHKGPVWLMYPFDHYEKYQNNITSSRAIWQITYVRSV